MMLFYRVEAGRKPRTGLKQDYNDGRDGFFAVSRQGENPERD